MDLKSIMKEEHEKLRGAPLEKKLQHFWDYYKWPAIILVVVLAVFISNVYSALTAKTAVLSGICLNCYESSFDANFEPLIDGFLEAQNLDSSRYTMELNANLRFSSQEQSEENYQTIQRIGAQITAWDLDFLIGDMETMQAFARTDTLCALSEILSEETLESYAAYIQCLDPASKEKAESGIPFMLDVSDCLLLKENYPYMEQPLVFAVAVNAPNQENLAELVDYLMKNMESELQ